MNEQIVEKRAVEPTGVDVQKMEQGSSKRAQIAARFDAESPGYVHLWVGGDTPEEDLEMIGYQKVKWPDDKKLSEALRGKSVRLRKDILCRVKSEDFHSQRRAGEDMSRQLVEQAMRGKDKDEDIKWSPRNLVAKAKDARDIGKPAN